MRAVSNSETKWLGSDVYEFEVDGWLYTCLSLVTYFSILFYSGFTVTSTEAW